MILRVSRESHALNKKRRPDYQPGRLVIRSVQSGLGSIDIEADAADESHVGGALAHTAGGG